MSKNTSGGRASAGVDGASAAVDDSAAGVPALEVLAADPASPASFESAITELESLIERMEGGRLPLEDSLAAYQRGVALVKYCRETLGDVAQRVRVLEADLLQPLEGADQDADG